MRRTPCISESKAAQPDARTAKSWDASAAGRCSKVFGYFQAPNSRRSRSISPRW